MLKEIFGYFADIVKQVLIKVITFALVILLVILAIKYLFNVDVFSILGMI